MAALAYNQRCPPCEARVGPPVSLNSNYFRRSFSFPRFRETIQVLCPRFHHRGHLVHQYY
ncbi:hypothetical protein DCAR_0518816 [Daucus carota subsp. sativus]|uniref:Uncharacterized protein n=1 Tax=Daucus carota subsp. sativus TaxID=79200 RepID=A0AAF1AYJ6_DAUCS|nr:hypothetical protein DCAR_0518816 [Daucus carota subsp. sativus]